MNKKIIILSFLFLLIDIIVKIIIDKYLSLNNSVLIINNFLYITKVYNEGASFSMMWGMQIPLIIFSIIILLFLINYQKKIKVNKRNMLAFSMIYSGILGNLIDRIIYGHVIDYLDFKIFKYDYPVFNIADILIVFGILLIIYAIYKKEDENEVSSK